MSRDKALQFQKQAGEYWTKELRKVAPVIEGLGFIFASEKEQLHIEGERYLQQAVTTASGRKLILLGRRLSDGKRVVIKATRDKNGAYEIRHERICRKALENINFSYDIFHSPKEVLFIEKDGVTLFIQEFIETKSPFVERPIEEQFDLALAAFKAQESAHATTYKHRRFAEKTFGIKDTKDYLDHFDSFEKETVKILPEKKALSVLLKKAGGLLHKNSKTIEQYGGFLTHTDFVPHNFRIVGNKMYLLDHSSLCFGNKHEGWARFINFMVLYNPPLAESLVEYVHKNRAPEEALSLHLMRIYRLGELIYYYANTLSKSSGDLLTLNKARIDFWANVLEAVLADKPIPREIVVTYKKTRDALRSEEEKKRQIGLH